MQVIEARNVSFPIFSISSVLLAPTLSNNLLSINKVTNNFNCYVTLVYSLGFQDSVMKIMITLIKKEAVYIERWTILSNRTNVIPKRKSEKLKPKESSSSFLIIKRYYTSI